MATCDLLFAYNARGCRTHTTRVPLGLHRHKIPMPTLTSCKGHSEQKDPRASLFKFTLSYANRHNIITALTRRAINLPYLHIIYNVMLRVQYVLWVKVPPSEVGLTTYLVNKWTVDDIAGMNKITKKYNLWKRVYTKTTSKNIYNIFSPNLNTLLGNTHIMLLIM